MRIGIAVPCYSPHMVYLENFLKSLELQTKKPDIVFEINNNKYG
jgi:hypothetical protein